jgi:hypothetical protein
MCVYGKLFQVCYRMIEKSYVGLKASPESFKSHDEWNYGTYSPFIPGHPWNKSQGHFKGTKGHLE